MSGPYMALREAGAFGWLVLALFLLGLLPGLASLVLGVMAISGTRVRGWARISGGVTLLFACLAFALGGAGTMYGRKHVERALGGIDVAPGELARFVRIGYLESYRCVEIAELLGGVLFVFGLAGVLLALGESKGPRAGEATSALESRSTKEGGSAFGFIGLGAAVLGLVPLMIGAAQPIPPPDPRPREDVDVSDAVFEALRSSYGCKELARALAATREAQSSGAIDLARLTAIAPDLPKALDACTAHLDDTERGTSIFCRFRPEACAPPAPAGGDTDRPAAMTSLRSTTPTVNGRLPPEIITRIVRHNLGPIKQCYEHAKTLGLTGRVVVKFVIDRSGNVVVASDGGSDFPDRQVTQCILHAFRSMQFPAPEGGIVTVEYPIVFTAAQ